MNSDPLRRRAIVALVLVNLLWGISFPAMKATNMIMDERQGAGLNQSTASTFKTVSAVVSASFLITLRFAIALAMLALFVPRLFRDMTADYWRMGFLNGLAFSAGFILQIVGLNYIPASRSGFLTSLSVVFTPLLMIVVERRVPRPRVAVGATIALFGTAVLTGLVEVGMPFGVRFASEAFGQIGLGDMLTVLAALIFAVQIIQIDYFSRRMPAGKLTPGMFVATLCVATVIFVGGQTIQPTPAGPFTWGSLVLDGRFMLLIVIMSLFCTVLAFHWMNKYQAHVSPAHASIIYTLEPIFATLWAMILPDWLSRLIDDLGYSAERPGWELIVGGSFVVTGNALALWPANKAEGEGRRP